jgi:hypothetical protein
MKKACDQIATSVAVAQLAAMACGFEGVEKYREYSRDNHYSVTGASVEKLKAFNRGLDESINSIESCKPWKEKRKRDEEQNALLREKLERESRERDRLLKAAFPDSSFSR